MSLDRYFNHLDLLKTLTKARLVLDFNEDWFVTEEPSEMALRSAVYDTSSWKPVTLPHDDSIEHGFSPEAPSGPSGGFVKTGILYYRKTFTLPEGARGKQIFLSFDGISMDSEIWVNGRMVARHPYAYTPTDLDLTPFVTFGEQENYIAVRTDTSLQPFSRFYQGSGIDRQAKLTITSPIHFDRYGVICKANATCDAIEVNTSVRVAGYPETVWKGFSREKRTEVVKDCSVLLQLYDETGALLGEKTGASQPIREFTKKNRLDGEIAVPSPKLWSVEEPKLYYIRAALYANGILEDDIVIPFGLRNLEWSPERGLEINHRTVKLKGVCLHQDGGMFGCAVPPVEWVRRIQILRKMGVNAIRTSHHPFPTEFYDLCDLYGMYVMDEAFDEWNKGWARDGVENPYGKNTYGYYQYFNQWSETDVRLMVKRDRNHPSVIMWSMGNEIPDYYYAEGVDDLRRLVRYTREEDSTRPVTVGAEGNFPLPIYPGIMESLDIAGYNYVNLKHPDYYEELHREHPNFTFAGTEDFFEPEQWDFIRKHPYVIGEFLWAGMDYLGESGCFNRIHDLSLESADTGDTNDPNFGGMGTEQQKEQLYHGWTAGMIDLIGQPKAQYYYHQSLWQEEPVVHVCVKKHPWNRAGSWKLIPGIDSWNGMADTKVPVYVFTNCAKMKLFLNGKEVACEQREPDRFLPFEESLSFVPGELTAKGYDKNDMEVASHTIYTTGSPAALAVSVETDMLHARSPWVYLDLTVQDAEGHPVLTDKRPVRISVAGGAKLTVLGSGSLYNRESYRSSESSFFNGHALAVLCLDGSGEAVKVTVQADGLPETVWTM